MLKTESFDQDWKLTNFINNNNITKEQIVSITVVPTRNYFYDYILFYYATI